MATHECMIDGCARRVEDAWAVCSEHYRLVPKQLANNLSRAYTPGMTLQSASSGLYLALGAANTWLRETFGGSDRKPHDPGRWDRLCRYVRARDEARARLREVTGAPPPPHLRLVP